MLILESTPKKVDTLVHYTVQSFEDNVDLYFSSTPSVKYSYLDYKGYINVHTTVKFNFAGDWDLTDYMIWIEVSPSMPWLKKM